VKAVTGYICEICGKKEPEALHEAEAFCELCGMAIHDSKSVPVDSGENGETIYFCCKRCKDIYKKEIINNKQLIKTLKEQRDFSMLEDYDDLVRGLIVAYIDLRYPMKDDEG
jgi:endogenous inhibitor of DNA gyrase (YacG/DUF329 family)